MDRSLYCYTLDSLLIDLVARGYRRGIVLDFETGDAKNPSSCPSRLPVPHWDIMEDEDGFMKGIDLHLPFGIDQAEDEMIEEDVYVTAKIKGDGSLTNWMMLETFEGSLERLDPQTQPTLDQLPSLLNRFFNSACLLA